MDHAGYGYNIPRVGDLVRDKDSDDKEGSVAITVQVHADTPASDYYIPALQKTVAEVNEEYPSDAPVVTVAYINDLEEMNTLRGWEQLSTDELPYVLDANNISTYDFPAPRLDLSASQEDIVSNESQKMTENSENNTSENSSSISSDDGGQFDLASVPENLPEDGSEDDRYVRRRSQYLKRVTNLREPLPQALAYLEIGYSSSGIAKKLDTRKDTVEKWMDEIADQFGEKALETRPQSEPVPDLE